MLMVSVALIIVMLIQARQARRRGRGPQGGSGEAGPVEGGAYPEALVGEIARLNPLLDDANQVDRDIDRLLYRGLVSFDGRDLPQPDPAEGWAGCAGGTPSPGP